MEITTDVIEKYLSQKDNGPCVSIYIPTQPSSNSQTINEDRIRFKNALQSLEAGAESSEELTKVLQDLATKVDDTDFWLHQRQSLAVFANPSGHEVIRLPYEIAPIAHAGERYVVSPLAIMKNLNRTYHVLDINFKQPLLYTGDNHELRQVEQADLPGAIDEELDITTERQSSVGARSGPGGKGAVFYGYAEVDESREKEATMYLRMLAESIDKALADQNDPLLLAGSPKVISEFKSMVKYHNILDDELAVEYSNDRQHDLHQAANQLIENKAAKSRHQTVERFKETDPELRADGVMGVGTAAEQGKVECLLLPVVRVTTDGVGNKTTPAPLVELPDDFEAFENAVRLSLEQSAEVIPVNQDDFSADPTMKAILRF